MTNVAIQLKNLTFGYGNGAANLFSDLSFSINQGEIIAILGRSGTGKTTLINLLAGFLLPSSGACQVHGKEVVAPGNDRIPIFQEDALWPWLRVTDNVTLVTLLTKGADAAKQQVENAKKLLLQVGLEDDTHNMYPKQLSTGMKKRVEIARALFAQPTTLLADEPFATLDPDTREDLHRLILHIWKERELTILLATHSIEEAIYLANRIIVFRNDSTTKLSGQFDNPFQGISNVQRSRTSDYFKLSDAIRVALRTE